MADNGEKKDKKSKVAAALGATLDTIAPEIEEGTVLRFKVRFDHEDPDAKDYTYTALFAGNRWFISGMGSALGREYQTTVEFFTALAKYRATDIEVAVKFDRLR